jgi:succinate dehydrogenase/fumarate reductase flavoprotein subunit
LRPSARPSPVDCQAAIREAGDEVLALDKALWRRAAVLQTSARSLDSIWAQLSDHTMAEGLDAVSAREAAAITATALLCNAAALRRTESRGLSLRADYPSPDPDLARRLVVGGLETVWSRYEAAAGSTEAAA